jgi:hypothetical protein
MRHMQTVHTSGYDIPKDLPTCAVHVLGCTKDLIKKPSTTRMHNTVPNMQLDMDARKQDVAAMYAASCAAPHS